ncbi:MAG: hypothetical protein ACK5MV_13650 [Aminipila sp.]
MARYQNQSTEGQIDNITFRWRFLWQQLSSWLREYMFAKSLNAESESLNQIVEKILSIVDEFGDLMRLFFGDKAADGYVKLLTDYVMMFIMFIDALSENDTDKANEIAKEIYEGLDQRSKYLFEVNPYWDRPTLDEYIFNFTSMTIQEITSFMEGDYKTSIEIYDRILAYSQIQSDFLAQGAKKYLNLTS